MNLNGEIDRIQEALLRSGRLIADVREIAAAGDDKEAANIRVRLRLVRAELAAHEKTLREMAGDDQTPDVSYEIIRQNLTTLRSEIDALNDVEEALSHLLHVQRGGALTEHAALLHKLKAALKPEGETGTDT